MRHHASRRFWACFRDLPKTVQDLATTSYEILKRDRHHPSLRLKRVGRFWSVRVGLRYRALAVEQDGDLIWFWIGSHADYDRLIG